MSQEGIGFKRLLVHSGVSQSDVAQHFNVSQASVSQWANKGIPGARLLELSRLLDVPPSEVEKCVYQPRMNTSRRRTDYRLRALDGSAYEKEQLINELQNHDFTTADLHLIRRMVERLSLN
ncbi:MAG: helix-turn-helix transcriptional regulator [Burkholderiaceae bacterium]